jgi:hypothetical protein
MSLLNQYTSIPSLNLNANIVIKNCSNKHTKIASKHNFVLMRTGQINYDVYSLDFAAPVKHTQKDLDRVVRALQTA